MNERTHFFIKNISLTLYSQKDWCWLCVRDELETWTDWYTDPAVLLLILTGVAQLWVTEGPKPSVCCWFSIRHLIPNWLKPSVPWLYYCFTPTYFRCSSAFLHRCISWLTTRSRVNTLHNGYMVSRNHI